MILFRSWDIISCSQRKNIRFDDSVKDNERQKQQQQQQQQQQGQENEDCSSRVERFKKVLLRIEAEHEGSSNKSSTR